MIPQEIAIPDNPVVLIVEDDEGLRDVLGEVLEAEGFQLIMTADGMTALELSRERTFHAALVDLNLPGRGGWQVAEELVSTCPTLRVIMMTGERDVRVPQGATLLQKPFTVEALLDRLHLPRVVRTPVEPPAPVQHVWDDALPATRAVVLP